MARAPEVGTTQSVVYIVHPSSRNPQSSNVDDALLNLCRSRAWHGNVGHLVLRQTTTVVTEVLNFTESEINAGVRRAIEKHRAFYLAFGTRDGMRDDGQDAAYVFLDYLQERGVDLNAGLPDGPDMDNYTPRGYDRAMSDLAKAAEERGCELAEKYGDEYLEHCSSSRKDR